MRKLPSASCLYICNVKQKTLKKCLKRNIQKSSPTKIPSTTGNNQDINAICLEHFILSVQCSKSMLSFLLFICLWCYNMTTLAYTFSHNIYRTSTIIIQYRYGLASSSQTIVAVILRVVNNDVLLKFFSIIFFSDETISEREGNTVVLTCPVDIDSCGDLHSLNWFKGEQRIAVFLHDENSTNIISEYKDR